MEDGDALRWRRGEAAPSRMAFLHGRHRMLRALRAWFDGQGFLEAETPALVRAPSPEPVSAPLPPGADWLITSPEVQHKRLLVGGFERIYRLGPVFRGGELGARHNPEFTMLELYQAYAGPRDLMTLTENLLRSAAQALTGSPVIEYQGERFDFAEPFGEVTGEAEPERANPEAGGTGRDRGAPGRLPGLSLQPARQPPAPHRRGRPRRGAVARHAGGRGAPGAPAPPGLLPHRQAVCRGALRA